MASCSSLKISKTVASLVMISSSMVRLLRFTSFTLPWFLRKLRRDHHQRAQTGAVDVVHTFQVEHQVARARGTERRHAFAQGAGLGTHRDSAFQVQNDDAFVFPLLDVQSHGFGG
jgi:hypothetical protein